MPGAVPITSTYALTNATLAVRARAGRRWRARGDRARPRAARGRERGGRPDDPPGGRRRRRHAVQQPSRRRCACRAPDDAQIRGRHSEMATRTQTELQQLHRRRARAAAEGDTEPVLNPATGEQIAAAPALERGGRRPRRAAAARAPSTAGRGTTPAQRSRRAARARRRRSRSTARSSRELESLNAGKPIEAVKRDEIPVMVDNLRFFAGAARCLEGRAAGEYMEGYTSMHPPRAGRRGRPGRAVELPADDGDLEDRPGARGRQHGRAQAAPRRRR